MTVGLEGSATNPRRRRGNRARLNPGEQRFPRLLVTFAVLGLALPAAAQPTGGDEANRAWHMPRTASAAPLGNGPTATTPPAATPAVAGYAGYSGYGGYAAQTGYGYGYAAAVYVPSRPPGSGEDAEVPEDSLAPPHLDIALGTLVPLALGPQITVELPGRFLVQGDIGWMPPAYGSLIDGIVRGFGVDDPIYEHLVEGALDDALVARLTAGWRPFPDAGFELFGGYTLIDLNGSAVPADIAQVVAGDFAAAVAEEMIGDTVELDSTLHAFHVGFGWRWVAFDHLVIRTNLAYTQAVASSSSITTPDAPALGREATPIVDEHLDEIYDTFVKLPVLGVSAGYRF